MASQDHNELRPEQKGWYVAANITKCIILNENHCILSKIALKFVSKSLIDNMPALA